MLFLTHSLFHAAPLPLWTSRLRLSVKRGMEMKVCSERKQSDSFSQLKPRVFRNHSRRISKLSQRMQLVSVHPVNSEQLINLRWNTTSLCCRKLLIGSVGGDTVKWVYWMFHWFKDEHPHLEGVWMFSHRRSPCDHSELVLRAAAGSRSN